MTPVAVAVPAMPLMAAQALPVMVGMPAQGGACGSQPPPFLAQEDECQPAVALQALASRGFPRGLASEVLNSSTQSFPIRLWVVDNSGSMQVADGSRLVAVAGGSSRMVRSTRWEELADTLGAIAEVSEATGGRTDFLLLNPPTRGGPQHASVGGDSSSLPVAQLGPQMGSGQLRALMQSVSPAGGTPLTEAVMQVISLLEPAVPHLTSRGQQAVVVLATDGMPNHPPSFLSALQHLQTLPVWLVVRLCTNDEAVVAYWNNLDKSLEAPLEVLDDEAGEAEEITALNPWLAYGPPLHLAREFGLRHRLFDLLDEAVLTPSQVRTFIELILGCGPLPEPELEWTSFMAELKVALSSAPSTVDPRNGQRAPWVNTRRLGRLHPSGALGAVCCPGGACTLL
uniref:VWFA domain-containing protein n=1 Tax=Haptolina brevifila TaxID=156173 RepID=A0A7S2N762_9EUKA